MTNLTPEQQVEKVREEIAQILWNFRDKCKVHGSAYKWVDEILSLVLIRDVDQSLPPICTKCAQFQQYSTGVYELRDDHFVKIIEVK